MHELYTEVKTGKAEDPSPFLTNSTSALIITKPRLEENYDPNKKKKRIEKFMLVLN